MVAIRMNCLLPHLSAAAGDRYHLPPHHIRLIELVARLAAVKLPSIGTGLTLKSSS
jgi:hypothetical protein